MTELLQHMTHKFSPNPPSETIIPPEHSGEMPDTLDDCTLNDMAHHDSTIRTAEESTEGAMGCTQLSQFSNLSVQQ